MNELPLQQNESVILQANGVCPVGDKNGFRELNLTNLRIIMIKRGGWGNKVKDMRDFPIRQIKIVNGTAQVFYIKRPSRDADDQLQIHLQNGKVEAFEFDGSARKEINNWINNINILLTGNSAMGTKQPQTSFGIPVVDELAGTVASTLGTFKSALGKGPVQVSIKCAGCHAPITGTQGQTVKCRYCDSENCL